MVNDRYLFGVIYSPATIFLHTYYLAFHDIFLTSDHDGKQDGTIVLLCTINATAIQYILEYINSTRKSGQHALPGYVPGMFSAFVLNASL